MTGPVNFGRFCADPWPRFMFGDGQGIDGKGERLLLMNLAAVKILITDPGRARGFLADRWRHNA